MLSNHLQNGIESDNLLWSRVPDSDDASTDGVGLLSSPRDGGGGVDSLDYEVIENYAYREEQAHRGKLYVGYYVAVKWFFSLLIGIGTGLAAVFINLSVENFAGWKFALTFAIIQKSYFAGFIVYLVINLVLVFSSAYIITQFAPAAAGSGIPEIKGYLNGIDIPGTLLFRTLIGKIFGSIGSVGGGLALGKEGPLVHTGACIASLLGQGGSTKYHLNSRWPQLFKSDRDRRDLVTCGCAAGVAAAFRAPVGGVLFALEEVTSWWRSQLMWRVFFTSAIVAVVVRTAMGWCKSGICGHFGGGGFIIWDVSDGQDDYYFKELLPMAVIGVIGGLLGALFNQLTYYMTSWRRNYLHKKGNRVKIYEACIISCVTSAISFGLPLLRKCSPCPETVTDSGIECPRPPGMYGNYVNFYCKTDNEYNDLATIFFNTQDDAIRNLFSAKTMREFSAQSLLTFLAMFYTLAVVTFGTAVPAGQFVPGIMIGSTYGRLVGMFVVRFYKKLNIEEGTYALLGAASFLGGSMRMTVSLCVIMVEITNNLKLLPLIMLVLLVSKAVGDAFNEGLYEVQARLKGIPLLESRPKYHMRQMIAKEACQSQKVISLPRVIRVADVASILRSNKHNGFPVIDHTRSGETLVIGLVLRSHLLVLLQSKVDFQGTRLLFFLHKRMEFTLATSSFMGTKVIPATLFCRRARAASLTVTASSTKIYTRLDSCLVIPPPPNFKKPRAIIKFLGGAFVGAVPELTYSYLKELLAKEGYLIVSVPYNVTFDHEQAAKQVYQRFNSCLDAIVLSGVPNANLNPQDLSNLPVFSVGHSNGALLQVLTGSYFSDKIPKVNAIISFNNKSATEAVPYFEQLGPLIQQMMPVVEASPLYEIARNASGDGLKALLDTAGKTILNNDQEALKSFTNLVDQLPSVFGEVGQGVSEFRPSPLENRTCFKCSYSVPHTLLVQFNSDAIDETDLLEETLRPRIESFGGTLEKVRLNGNHLTPCIQDPKWQIGSVYTPADAVAQALKTIPLRDTRVLSRTIVDWFTRFEN